ncbi:hypothetical protein [Leifsonia sp. 22587]|uniref:hypothetical protein n=1 Tax=Leifsonia sp. 22587 TaxID=3453946 RepID=UPI003F85A462
MTTDPRDFVVGPDARISDIDLDTEEFLAPDGERLTEERAEALARRAANLVPGRKSLGGDGSVSPVLQFRTPRKREAEQLAHELGIRTSELARRALDEYLDNHARGA